MGKEKKLSFSFSAKSKPSSSNPNNPLNKIPNPQSAFSSAAAADADDETTKPQFFTVFDPTQAPPPGPASHVIPPISNDFRAGIIKKIKNLQSHDPSDPDSDSKFVLEANSDNQDSSDISYGLTLRSNQDQIQDEEKKDLTLRRFREDMKNLPDDRGMDEFADVPVESFAAAVLAGYGWSEGRGIGRNANADTKIVHYDRRAGTQGLGYGPSTKKKSSYAMPSSVRWLRSHIRVRVTDKEVERGRLYLKKGEVVDVVGPTTCDILIDGRGELVQGVDQESLETALPKCGGSVLVLYGKHEGVYGNLVERNMEEETGVVRDADSHALINVRLEQIAEYVGDPSYLGY